MKWGRKKSKSTGLSPLPQIFPTTWLSMLKHKSSTTPTKSQPSKPKQNNKQESYSTQSSSSIPVCFRSSRLSDGDGSRFLVCSQGDLAFPAENQERSRQNFTVEDDFWRFSFGEQSNWSKDGEGVSSENENEFQSLSGRSNGKSAGRSICKFPESLNSTTTKPDEERLAKTLKSTAGREAERDSKGIMTSDNSTSKKHGKIITPNSRKSDHRIAKESTESIHSEQEPAKNPKSEDKKRENVPKSPRRNRELRRRKIRNRSKTGAHSPGTALRMEMCKIRAVEDLKKAKKKRERKKGRSFESFAVIKSSFNPHQDFRESMMEMICEKEIGDAEELEKLLDCYLSLNSDEYHEIIVKVFRQVLFDLNQEDSSDSEFGQSYYY